MTESEQYLFDVLGFVLLEDVLSAGEVAELNQLVDEQVAETPHAGERPLNFGDRDLLAWGQPFCDLRSQNPRAPYNRCNTPSFEASVERRRCSTWKKVSSYTRELWCLNRRC